MAEPLLAAAVNPSETQLHFRHQPAKKSLRSMCVCGVLGAESAYTQQQFGQAILFPLLPPPLLLLLPSLPIPL